MGRVLDSRLSQINASINTVPYAQSLRDNLQQKINDGSFKNASDYFTIQKESSTTPNLYEDIGVRITVPYQLSQRFTIKDDCRELIFGSNDVENNLGDRYQFNGFYWITVDTGRVETPTNSCQLERCNSTLKFYDENGDYNEIPCIAQSKSVYDVKQDKMIWIPDGKMRVLVKYDLVGKKINIDKRFLINGLQWRCGSRDYVTYVRNGQGYIEFFFASDFESPNDDTINGVADALTQKATYSIQILNGTSIQSNISSPLPLSVQVTKTQNSISTILSPTPSLVFSSSDITTATVSNLGIVTWLKIGSVTITCKLASNLSVQSQINITGISTAQDNFTYSITGNTTNDSEIKMGSTVIYTGKKFNNSIQDNSASFVFSIIPDTTPTSAYTFGVLSGNTCSLKCNNYTFYVNLKMVDVITGIETRKQIKLRGVI